MALVEIRIRGDEVRARSVFVIVSRRVGTAPWHEIGISETDHDNSSTPTFSRPFALPYVTEEDKDVDLKVQLLRREGRHGATAKTIGVTAFSLETMAAEPTHRLRLRLVGDEVDPPGYIYVFGEVCRDPPPIPHYPCANLRVRFIGGLAHSHFDALASQRRCYYTLERRFNKTDDYLLVYVSELVKPSAEFAPVDVSARMLCLWDDNRPCRLKVYFTRVRPGGGGGQCVLAVEFKAAAVFSMDSRQATTTLRKVPVRPYPNRELVCEWKLECTPAVEGRTRTVSFNIAHMRWEQLALGYSRRLSRIVIHSGALGTLSEA